MSINRQDDEFLPIAGLNLAVPVAKDQTSALVLKNCRPDRLEGRVRSRLGHGSALATYADAIHTIWMFLGSTRFVGAGAALYRDTTSVITGLDGTPLFLASKNRFTWVTNRNAQKRISGAGVVRDWYTSPPTGALTATDSTTAGNVDGDVEYYVSYVDSDGFETGLGPVATVTVANKIVDLTGIPTGPAGIASRRIYRAGGTLEQPLLVQTIADNTTTTGTDNMPDTEAIGNNETAIFVYDPPPAASGCCHYLGARLLLWSSADRPNTIWWSRTDLFHFIPRFNRAGIGDHDEEILVVSPKANGAFVYKERSIWRLLGDPDSFASSSIEPVTTKVSLVGKLAVAQGGESDYILSRDGVYEFDGYRAVKISAALDPIFNGEGVATGSGEVLQAINLQHMNKAVLELSGVLLYVSYPGGSSTTNSTTAVYNTRTRVWCHDSRGFGAITVQGSAAGTLVGIGTGLFNLENGQTDAGTAIPFAYQSSFRHQGAPDNDKQYFSLKVKHELGAQEVAVKVFFGDDTGASPTTLTTDLTGNGITEFVFNGDDGIFARCMSVLIEALPGVTAEIQIESMLCVYMIHPRTTKQWVSGTLSFDDLMEVRAVRVERDPVDDFTIQIRHDNPAASDMTSTDVAVAISGTPGRRVFPRQIGSTPKGYLFQIAVDEPAGGRTYNGKLEMRRVPIYLSGARAEKWQPATRGIR